MSAVTQEQMEEMFSGSSKYTDSINTTLSNFNISHIAMFISQIGAESGNLTIFEENLHYSAQRLIQVFPSLFNSTNAAAYDNQPEKIANRIYANRMGNGDEASGDGWTYRGRGAIQLTGKNNYLRFAQDLNMNLSDAVNYISTNDGIFMSAGFFWYDNNIESVADDFIAKTKKINGGLNGLNTRQALYNKAKTIFDN